MTPHLAQIAKTLVVAKRADAQFQTPIRDCGGNCVTRIVNIALIDNHDRL
jgi:hypothetical protein